MSKPILVIKIPVKFEHQLDQIQQNLSEVNGLREDYYIFIIPNSVDEYDFKVFNGKYTDEDYTTIETFIEGLKNQ